MNAKTTKSKRPVPALFPVLLLLSLVAGLTLAYIVRAEVKDRNGILALSEAKSQSQAELIGQRASSLIEMADLALISILAQLHAQPDNTALSTAPAIFRRQLLHLEQIRQIAMFDADGKLLSAQPALPPPEFDTRDLIVAHRDRWIDLEVQNQKGFILLSRRVDDTKGVFSGALLAVIDPGVFYSHFDDYKSADMDRVGLWDTTGRILALFPRIESPLDDAEGFDRIDQVPLFDSIDLQNDRGGGLRLIQNRNSMVAIYQLRAFPFFIGVARDKAALLAPWRINLRNELLFSGIMLLVAASLTLVARRQWQQRRNAENALLASRIQEELYREMFETNHAVKMLVDPADGAIVDANSTACAFYGYPKNQLVGMSIFQINTMPEPQIRQAIHEALHRKTPYFEFSHRLASGEIRAVEVYSGPLQYQQRLLLHSIVLDVTDRKRMEKVLVHAKKMESAAIVSGGIAHDFNNLLTIIQGYIELAQDVLKTGGARDAVEDLDRALDSTEKARKLVHKFLTIAAGASPRPQPVVLQTAIARATENLRAGSPRIHCELVGSDPVEVYADPDQVLHVFDNLLTNAAEAMPQGGPIEIETSVLHIDQSHPAHAVAGLSPGNYASVTFADHGKGIAKDRIAYIFDPYYSTKERGAEKGMGLGLTMAYAIMRQHKGWIDVQSEPGRGTRCIVYFPLSTSKPELFIKET